MIDSKVNMYEARANCVIISDCDPTLLFRWCDYFESVVG